MKIEELERYWAVSAEDVLKRTVAVGKSELEIISNEINLASKIRIAEREVTLPGMTKWKKLILKVVADFRKKKGVNVMPQYIATAEQITVEPLRPEIFDEDNYEQAGLSAGTFDIIPKGASGVYDVVTDEERIIVTDFVEYNPAANTTAVQAADVDGEDYNPLEFRRSTRGSDIQIIELPYPYVAARTLDLDGKVEFSGDAELTPMGIHVCLGAQLPDLT